MSFQVRMKPCVLLFFNLSSMDELKGMANMALDPLIENPDGTLAEPTTDSHLNGRNGPRSDLEIIGELTEIWMRTVKNHPAVDEGLNVFRYRKKSSDKREENCAFFAHFETNEEAETFRQDLMQQPHSFDVNQAYGKNILVWKTIL